MAILCVLASAAAAAPPAGRARAEVGRRCDRGDGAACAELAAMARRAVDGPPDVNLFTTSLRRACARGQVAACFEAVDYSVDDDAVRAELAKRCRRGSPDACAVGVDVALGQAHDDSPELYDALVGACRNKSGRACEAAARRAFFRGADVERPLLAAACDLGRANACRYLGTYLAEGRGGPADPPGAARAFDRACEIGLRDDDAFDVCLAVARDLSERPPGRRVPSSPIHAAWATTRDPARARAYFTRILQVLDLRCAQGWARSCDELYTLVAPIEPTYKFDPSPAVPKDAHAARRLARVACDGGVADSCSSFARMAEAGDGGPVDRKGALAALGRGCEIDEGSTSVSCVKAGDAAVAGGEGAARALAWYERGCAHAPASPEDNPQVVPLPRNHLEIVSMMSIGSSDDPQDVAKACMAAAALLRRERHDDRAAPLERRACELGAKGACADAR